MTELPQHPILLVLWINLTWRLMLLKAWVILWTRLGRISFYIVVTVA